MAAKSKRINIRMESTESPHSRTTSKNTANTANKLERMYYDPVLRRHVLYKEKKLK